MFEISNYSQWEEKIERGWEKEREGSLVPIFAPLNFKIVRMLANWIDFFSKVLALRVEHGFSILNLIRAFCIEFEVL